jgi:hypothetical protein
VRLRDGGGRRVLLPADPCGGGDVRNISFSTTIPQFRARQKHVTRRGNADGPTWKNLKPDNQLMGCEKVQGIKKGELVRMGPITVLEVNQEPLNEIIRNPFRDIPIKIDNQYQNFVFVPETVLEGFPEWAINPVPFVEMFCKMNNCEPETEITRILFDYVGRIA